MSKVFDYTMYIRVNKLDFYHIVKEQNGIMLNRSVIMNLIIINNFILDLLNSSSSGQVDSAYLYFSKAFDSIDHNVLMQKFYKINLELSLINFISYHIPGRKYRVNINDVKVFKAIEKLSGCSLLQVDLTAPKVLAAENHPPFNICKCNIVTLNLGKDADNHNYSLQDIPLTEKTNIRELRTIYNDKFNFDDHIDHVVSTALKKQGFPKFVARYFFNPFTITYSNKTIVLLILLFRSTIMTANYSGQANIQHKVLRLIHYKAVTTQRRRKC